MQTLMKSFISNYLGILIGSIYGLTMRIVFEVNILVFTDLFSITFIWITPVIIGITPMLFATKEQLSSIGYRVSRPFYTILLFFLFCFVIFLSFASLKWVVILVGVTFCTARFNKERHDCLRQ